MRYQFSRLATCAVCVGSIHLSSLADEPTPCGDKAREVCEARLIAEPFMYDWMTDEGCQRMIDALAGPDIPGLEVTIGEVARYGTHATAAIPKLLEFLDSEETGVRRAAARALVQVGTGDRRVLAGFGNALVASKDEAVRRIAAQALPKLRLPAKEVLPPLLEALSDDSSVVRGLAASAVGDLGHKARSAVPELMTMLKDGEDVPAMYALPRPVRFYAIDGLAKIGAAANEAVPQLRQIMLRDEHPEV